MQEGLQKFGSMPKRKPPPGSAPTSGAEVGTETNSNDAANASDEEVEEIAKQAFPRRPSQLQGSKAVKGELVAHSKWEKIMQKQVLASERMAEASLLKATAMQDQCALLLFTMPIGEGLTKQAQRYIELCHTEEIERLERCIESERWAAELAKVEHERLLKECNYEAPRSRRGRTAAAPTSPAVTAAPPRMPEPAIANAAAGTFHFLNFFLLLRSSCLGLRPPPVSIHEHADCCSALLQRAQSQSPCRIGSLLEPWIECSDRV